MNTVRHPAAPTQADVAFCQSIRTTFGPALYAGHWPATDLIEAVRLVEDMDLAETRHDHAGRMAAALALLASARGVAPDLADLIDPAYARAA